MGKISKTTALILTLTIAMSCVTLLVIKPAYAQSVPTPSVPEFAVKFVDASYNVSPTSSIDPYSGQNVTNESYHVENRTIELIIKNQPFDSYIANRQNISFYFNVREKGHYEENWTTLYSAAGVNYPTESNADYTTLTYLLDQNDPPFWNTIPSGGQVDFQVEALIGYISRTAGFASWYFAGQESGWSPTQTVTIPASSVSPIPTPTVPEFPLWTIPLLSMIMITGGLSVYFKKYAQKKCELR